MGIVCNSLVRVHSKTPKVSLRQYSSSGKEGPSLCVQSNKLNLLKHTRSSNSLQRYKSQDLGTHFLPAMTLHNENPPDHQLQKHPLIKNRSLKMLSKIKSCQNLPVAPSPSSQQEVSRTYLPSIMSKEYIPTIMSKEHIPSMANINIASKRTKKHEDIRRKKNQIQERLKDREKSAKQRKVQSETIIGVAPSNKLKCKVRNPFSKRRVCEQLKGEYSKIGLEFRQSQIAEKEVSFLGESRSDFENMMELMN